MHFDYQPLQQPVTFGDATAYGRQKTPGSKAGFWFGIIFGALFLVALLVVWIVANGGDAIRQSTLMPIVYVGLCAFLVFLLMVIPSYLYSVKAYALELHVKRFADANGIGFYSGPIDTPSNGIIFNKGWRRTYNVRLGFANQNVSEIGNIEFTIGSGKSQETYHYSYARLKLPRKLPHILLDSRKNDGFLGLKKIPFLELENNQKMQLEGDFNDYFTLYVPAGYEQDALYVFTPDVMQLMVDTGARFDAEIVDDDLYIFQPKHIEFRDGTQIEEIMTLAEKMHPEFASQVARYADERVASPELNTIDPKGQRLENLPAVRLRFLIPFVIILGVCAAILVFSIIWTLFS